MSITSVVNDVASSVSVINAQKPLPPTISSYSVGGVDDTALDPAGGQTVQINGTGFLPGATITFDGSAVAVVTYVNPNRLTFTSPAKTAGTYTIYVVNADGGTAIYIPGIIYSVLPTWTTNAGTLGSYYETTSISNTVVASGDAPITYSLFSGSLPTGSTLYANGVITGTAPVDSSSTTYSFTIQATDAQLQDSTRSFSLTINVDAVTWVSPANNTTYTSAVNSAIANVTLSATDAAGYAVSYSANALPTGLSLSGANISGTPTVIADSSTLLTATAATTNRSAVRTINWSITVANDPYFEYNTLLIPGASTTFVDDASTNNFAVSIFGDTKPNSFNPYTPGYYSNYFDGTGDYISVPDNVAFTMGAGDFTLECWVYLTSISQQVFIGTCNAAGSQGSMSFTLGISNTGTPRVAVGYAGTMYYSSAASTISTGQWHHVAGVRNSAMVNIYVNGVKGPDLNMAALAITDSSEVVGIGRNGAYNGEYVTGYISNVRIVKGTAVYTANFTPPTSPLTAISGTSLLTCQSNRFIDNSTNAFTVTVGGNTTVNSFDPFTPNTSYSTYGSGYFDGTGDYLTVPGNSVFAFGTGDFTVEVWLYANSISTGTFDRICATSDYNGSGFDWTLNTSSSGLYLAGTSYNIGSITPKVWHHLVYTRSGSVIRGFLNGNLSSYTTGASQNVSSITQLNIGTGYSGTPLNGYMVDLRIIKGSIPAGYQTSSTTTGTQIFTPPTAPLTAIANTSLLVLQNNQSVNNSVFLDNSSNNFLVTRAGNTTQGTFSPYGGNWSNYFDGTGDYLQTPASSMTTLIGTIALTTASVFTIECWIYQTQRHTAAGAPIFLGDMTPTSFTDYWSFGPDSAGLLAFYWYDGNSKQATGNTTIPLNTWTHISVVINATNIKLFVNGTLQTLTGTTTLTSASGSTGYLVIGQYNNGGTAAAYYGYTSNIRIVKSALYSTTFTPSTTPLIPITNTSLLTCQSPRFIDNSINNLTITKAGDTSVQRFSPFNPSSVTPTSYSGYFDGTGDYLTATGSTSVSFGTGDFTIEGWFNTAVGTNNGFLQISDTAGGFKTTYVNTIGISLLAGKLNLYGVAGTGYTSTGSSYATSTWTHFALVRSSSVTKLYINGVLDTTIGTSGSITDSTNYSMSYIAIGGYYSTAYLLTGYLSNIRIVKGIAVYTGAFTVPTSPLAATQSSGTNIAAITGTSTSLLTCQSPTFIDNSTNNFTITAAGNSQPTIQNPFGFTSATTNGYTVSTIGGSGYFDRTASNQYLTLPDSTFWALGTTATIELWYYPVQSPDISRLISIPGVASGAAIDIYDTAGQIGAFNQGYGPAIKINQWTHIAVVLISGTWSLYYNGVKQTVTGGNTGCNITATGNLWIGAISQYGQYTGGYLSDIRITKGSAVYTSNFVPPAQPLPAIQNTVALLNMTSAGIYDAAMMNNMVTVADAKLSTAVSKFGGSSMSFDGSGDRLSTAPGVINSLGSGDFTIEGWVYPLSLGSMRILSQGTYAAGEFLFILNSNGSADFCEATTSRLAFSAGSFVVGEWKYFAIVRSGSGSNNLKGYINGTLAGTGTSSSYNYNATTAIFVGSSPTTPNQDFQGYIDDLRITRGYARYTSNFSAPTSAFPVY